MQTYRSKNNRKLLDDEEKKEADIACVSRTLAVLLAGMAEAMNDKLTWRQRRQPQWSWRGHH